MTALNLLAWLKFAALNTLRNRRRSAVTVTIAALGTAAILLAGGFALSTYQALAEASARRGVFEVWVTHMFVLNDLVGVNTASGEGLILQSDASGAPRVLERLAVPI